MIYGTSAELNLERAVENIRLASHQYKRELDAKDEEIHTLKRNLEILQSDYRLREKENSSYKEWIKSNTFLEQRLSTEQSKNEELQVEKARLDHDLVACHEKIRILNDKVAVLESENGKANHIIRTLFKKVHHSTKPLSTSATQQNHQNHLSNRAGISM